MRIGYARVSTRDQNPDAQRDALDSAGCERVFLDKVSGKLARRPQLDQALQVVRAGDQLVIPRLDRLGRSLAHRLELSADLDARGIDLVVLPGHRHLDRGRADVHSATRCGRRFRASLLSERTLDGLEAARAAAAPAGSARSSGRARSRWPGAMYEETGPDGRHLYTVAQIERGGIDTHSPPA